MPAVQLMGFAQSTYVRTARLVCEEKGIDYALLPLDFRGESHRAVHPYLRMPVLRHGDLCLFETLAIASYLNAAFDGPDLEPGPPAARARMLQWISVANAYLYEPIVGRLGKADGAEDSALAEAVSQLRPVEAVLLESPFLAGDRLTLADLFLLPMLLYAGDVFDDSRLHASLPALGGWLERLRERPGVRRTEG